MSRMIPEETAPSWRYASSMTTDGTLASNGKWYHLTLTEGAEQP